MIGAASATARMAREKEEEKYTAEMGRRLGPKVIKQLKRMGDASAWLTRLPSWAERTQLTHEEFLDVIQVRYMMRS